jgi:hypothetical protein
MDNNYTGNGSNNSNGFQIDRYFLDKCNAYISSHSKQSNAQKQQSQNSLQTMKRKRRQQPLHQGNSR